MEYQSTPARAFRDVVRPLRRIVAAQGRDSFFHWTRKEVPGLCAWNDDPIQQRLFVRGETVVVEYPMSRAYVRSSSPLDSPLPGTASDEFLFGVLGWWPFDGRPPPSLYGRVPVVLRDIAASDEYRVEPRQVLMGDRWCHVITHAEGDRVWVDTERNGVFMAREFTDGAGAVLQRIEMGSHRECAPGIWVPMEMRNIVFDARDATNARSIRSDATIHVVAAHINQPLPESLFQFTPGPGYLRLLDDGRCEQTEPGGFEHLDELADWLRRHPRRRPTSGVWEVAEPVGEAGVILASLALCVRAYRHSRPVSRQAGGANGASKV